MSDAEFQEWLDYHVAAFPAVQEWLERVPKPEETWTHWKRALSDVTLDAARQATDLMLSGEEPVPMGHSNHPPSIRAIVRRRLGRGGPAGRQAPRYIDGQITYGCRECEDTGVRIIVRQQILDMVRRADNPLEEVPWGKGVTVSVACSCGIGEQKTIARRVGQRTVPGLIRFNPVTMLPHNPGWSLPQLAAACEEFTWQFKADRADPIELWQ